MTAPAYVPRTVVRLTDPAAQLAALNRLAECSQVTHDLQLFRTNAAGDPAAEVPGSPGDLTPYVVRGDNGGALGQVSRDCTAEVAGKLNLTISTALTWGSDAVRPWLLAQSREAVIGGDPSAWWAFPMGIYVCTSPGIDNLDAAGNYPVTGYDRCYLLQSQPAKSFAFAAGSTYAIAIRTVMRASGAMPVTAALSDVCDYPGDWAAKTLQASATYPVGSGKSHLQIVNELLAESGCRPLYASPQTGRFAIDLIPKTAQQPLLWKWAGGPGTPYTAAANYPARRIVRWSQQQYKGDVYNATNRWVFVQSNLTFQPVEGSGQYTVDNVSDGVTSQSAVGRVLVDARTLDATGQTDLKTQGDAIVAAEKAKFESLTLTTRAWPIAGHFDVFGIGHPALPLTSTRRLQVQQWTTELDGSGTTWSADVVGTS